MKGFLDKKENCTESAVAQRRKLHALKIEGRVSEFHVLTAMLILEKNSDVTTNRIRKHRKYSYPDHPLLSLIVRS